MTQFLNHSRLGSHGIGEPQLHGEASGTPGSWWPGELCLPSVGLSVWRPLAWLVQWPSQLGGSELQGMLILYWRKLNLVYWKGCGWKGLFVLPYQLLGLFPDSTGYSQMVRRELFLPTLPAGTAVQTVLPCPHCPAMPLFLAQGLWSCDEGWGLVGGFLNLGTPLYISISLSGLSFSHCHFKMKM